MHVLVFLAIFALTASAAPFDVEVKENGWHVPQIDGSFVWMTTSEAENFLAEHEKRKEIVGRLDLCPVSFYLYTKSNYSVDQKITADKNSISKSNFNATNPTRIIIHGWIESYKANMNVMIRDAWHSHGDYNIIVVDWGRARSIEYFSSVSAVPDVGKKVADMIDYLVSNHSLNLDTLVVIGHSLGAHVAGYAGKNVGSGKIHAIVGLDPAYPLFSYDKPNQRLNSDDAHYVESIHTCGGKLGFLQPIGKSAFYPNGGKKQPGCGIDLTGACSHERSCIYYAEAVRENNFPSMSCGNYEDAVKNECGGQYSGVQMGAVYNYDFASGDYYVPVRSTAPYGYGV